jgi:hypothetical protein
MGRKVKIADLKNLDVYSFEGTMFIHMYDNFYNLKYGFVDEYDDIYYSQEVEVLGRMEVITAEDSVVSSKFL